MAKSNSVKSHPKTRQLMNCPIFGSPSELSTNMLPTKYDVMRDYLLQKHTLKINPTAKEPTFSEIAEVVTKRIENLWCKASLPVISHQKILEKMRLCHDRYRNILKPYKSRHQDPKYQAKIDEYIAETKAQLFDISTCKCLDIDFCKCQKDRKVPLAERHFLVNQRTSRTMMIGRVDVKMTKSIRKKAARKMKNLDRSSSDKKTNNFKISQQSHTTSESEISDEEQSVVFDKEPPKLDKQNNIAGDSQMPANLASLARECDRRGVSDRCAAALATAVLQDVGMIKDNDYSMVIDRSKVRRERIKIRKQLQTSAVKEVSGLYFDGRKDKTRIQVRKGRKYYPKIVSEEHISLVCEPNSQYLGHTTPESGSSKSIQTSIANFLKINQIQSNNLVAIGCDGTAVNTGPLGGVICLLERQLGRPVHWFVCMLHGNELPLRHLMQNIDGVTHGPQAFSGVIGKALVNCELQEIVHYSSIPLQNCPNMDEIELSTDQQYLYNICKAVASGSCNPDLALQKPGPLCHSRWLTTANRLLRLYVSSEHPSNNLVQLATFVMKVYAPVWFNIKTKPACTEGSKHLWKLVNFSRYLDKPLRDIVDTVIQRNAFFGHAENILIAMLSDERTNIRELAYRRILAARSEKKLSSRVREFRIPPINFEAKDYTELVEWQQIDRYEPPLTKHISDEEIVACIKSHDATQVHELEKFPCHTQATERCVRLVTEASASVCGQSSRDGFIRAGILSRGIMKTFNTKSEFRLS